MVYYDYYKNKKDMNKLYKKLLFLCIILLILIVSVLIAYKYKYESNTGNTPRNNNLNNTHFTFYEWKNKKFRVPTNYRVENSYSNPLQIPGQENKIIGLKITIDRFDNSILIDGKQTPCDKSGKSRRVDSTCIRINPTEIGFIAVTNNTSQKNHPLYLQIIEDLKK